MRRKKGIIFVTPWFGAFAGGAEVLVRRTAIECENRGIECLIFTTCSKSPYDNWWEDSYRPGIYEEYGLKTYRFSTNKEGKTLYERAVQKILNGEELTGNDRKNFFYCGINSESLIKTIEDFMDAYEIIATPYFHGLTHALLNRYPQRISLIPCFHDEEQFHWPETTIPLLRNAKVIFFNSRKEKELTIKVYGTIVGRKVVEGPITGAIVPVTRNITRQDDSNITSLPQNYFVYIGRKERGKNIHILCEWFKWYKRESNRDSKLICIGGGDKSLIPKDEDIIDYGYVSETEKEVILRRSKGLITLSNNESFCFVIMEAWAQGIPVVVSGNCDVAKDHVVRCNGGFYVSDEYELCAALKFMEENPLIARYMGENGRRYVEEWFNPEVVILKYLRELEI